MESIFIGTLTAIDFVQLSFYVFDMFHINSYNMYVDILTLHPHYIDIETWIRSKIVAK